MRPWGSHKRCVRIDRSLLTGGWVELDEGLCMRCEEPHRLYTSVKILFDTYLLRRVFRAIFHGYNDDDQPPLRVCAECSQIYACSSHDDTIREIDIEGEGQSKLEVVAGHAVFCSCLECIMIRNQAA